MFLITYLSTFLHPPSEDTQTMKGIPLKIEKAFQIPLRELSGLSLKKKSLDTYEIYAIGDRHPIINILEYHLKTKKLVQKGRFDFAHAISARFLPCHSDLIASCSKLKKSLTAQWEAVATDASDRIYLLNEQLATIMVYEPTKDTITHTLNLESFVLSNSKTKDQDYRDQENNALGEGLILLKNNHILIAKERMKTSIYEFAGVGESPKGYQSALALGKDDIFELNEENKPLYPVHRWKLLRGFSHCDLSEIAIGPDGKLFGISQKCKWISSIHDLNPKKKRLKFLKTWRLPSEIDRAEAFVVLDSQGTFLVAEDRKSKTHKNLFLLAPE